MFGDYRQDIIKMLGNFKLEGFERILYFGDHLGELHEFWEKEGREVVFLNKHYPQYIDFHRENPDYRIKLPPKHFDLLLSHHGLEQVLDPEWLLLELRQALKDSGYFYTVTFNFSHISTLVSLMTDGWDYKEDGVMRYENIRFYTSEALSYLLKETGFNLEGEQAYQYQQVPFLTRQLTQISNNPAIPILSFIMYGSKVTEFPFIDGSYGFID